MKSPLQQTLQLNLRRSLQLTWPVMLGYFPMAMAFGVLASDPLYAFLSGILVYAGASQFLSIKFLETHATLFEIALSTFVLNVRHVFYSLQFVTEYSKLPKLQKWYSVFALTDETYAVLAEGLAKSPAATLKITAWVSGLNQFAWVMGCLFGAFLKQAVGLELKGLEFMLVGLFIVLLVENLKRSTNKTPAVVAAATGILFLNLQIPGWLFFAMAAMLAYGLWSTRARTTPKRLNDLPEIP